MRPNYLVTGSAGFIGAKVAELLLEQGCAVTGVDNLNDAYDVRLKEWRLQQTSDWPNFTFVHVDITDIEALHKVFDTRFDAVINLAARAGVPQSVENPWVYLDANTTGTLNLLELCREFEVNKFILSSTSSLYGANNPQPFREDASTDCPLSPYAASKKGAEVMSYAYHHLYGIDVTVPRYFTVYGPAGRPDMSIFRFVKWIAEGDPVYVTGDGKQSRDFTYVDDIARGTIAALKPVGYEVVNLGSDTPVGIMDAIHMIEDQLGEKAKIEFLPSHPADMKATWADIGKAEELLNWRPRVDIEQGIRMAVDWYQENRAWARDVVTS